MPEGVLVSFVVFPRQCAPVDVGAIFQLSAHIVCLRGSLAAGKIYQRQLASVDLQQHWGSGKGGTIRGGLASKKVWGGRGGRILGWVGLISRSFNDSLSVETCSALMTGGGQLEWG